MRYVICPEHAPQDRIAELTEFCVESKIEEVMLLFGAGELAAGYPSIEELKPWVDVCRGVKQSLDSHGIALSIKNPWTTTFHVAGGCRLKPEQNFTLMVNETGGIAKMAACPLCENWRKYLCRTFSYLAAEIQPAAIWIENDWRLDNFEPDTGSSCGCFCDLHLKRFADAVGRSSVTRDEVISAILADGEIHPWRKIWFDLWRQSTTEPVAMLRDAVKKASPQTRLALMSSMPDIHSIEHRDWPSIQAAFGFEPAFLTQPYLPPHTEMPAIVANPAVTRRMLTNLKRPIEVYPGLESSTRNGIYSKSKRYSAMECLESVCYGAAGVTISHYDMMGNGISLDAGFGKMLASIKKRLNVICEFGLDDATAAGAVMLFSPEEVLLRRYDPVASNSCSLDWANTLYILGINFGFRDKVTDTTGRAVFACDQTLRAFSDEDIKKLLGGVLVLDAASIEILQQRGFGEYLGIKTRGWANNDAGYAYEEITDGGRELYGVDCPRMAARSCSDKILLLDASVGGKMRTEIKTAEGRHVCDGLVTYRNSLGGVVVSTAYPLGRQNYYMGYFNIYRKTLWQELLWELGGGKSRYAMAVTSPMRVYRNRCRQGEFIALLNTTLDDVAEVVIRVGDMDAGAAKRVKMIDSQGQRVDLNVYFPTVLPDGSQRWKIHQPIPAMNIVYLLVENG